jgi:hypothetical protein
MQLVFVKLFCGFEVAINDIREDITQVNANPEPLTKLGRKDHNINAEAKEGPQTEHRFEEDVPCPSL